MDSSEDKLLTELRVKDFGIIEETNWRLGRGLNVITGETGAGKSLVIDAVEALLAGRVDEESIRYGASEAYLEGVFTLPSGKNSPQLGELLTEKGLKTDEETLVINCEFRRQGRSIFRVNRQAVPKGLLHQIGRLLIDIHGQSEHLSLLNEEYHLDFLDAYAHTLDLRHSFGDKATKLHQTEQELKALAEREKELARQEEFLRFQVDEIREAKLHEGEEEELENERNILASSEKLKAMSYEAYQFLRGGDSPNSSSSVLDSLSEATRLMKNLMDIDSTLKRQISFLEETSLGLDEVARDIHSYSEQLEYDPARLEEIESRLELIRGLKRKYGHTIAEILGYLEKAEGELEGISHSSERRAQLEATGNCLKEEMGHMASELSKARSQAANKLMAKVKEELQDLNMPQVEFKVSITQSKTQEGIPFPDGEYYAFNKEGADTVEFMASTNPGEPLRPLAKIASTGEISRFMLALKGALSEVDDIPVLIFDEIDIGVGGRSGEIIGKKLWALARNRQVICVTHLPQIATFANAHFSVHKETAGTRTLSTLEAIEGESRVREIATMLAGPQYTDTSINNACELIQKAETWKQAHHKGN